MLRRPKKDFNYERLRNDAFEQYAEQVLAPFLVGGAVDQAMGNALVDGEEFCRVPYDVPQTKAIDLTKTKVFRDFRQRMKTKLKVHEVNLGFYRTENGAVQHVINVYFTEAAFNNRRRPFMAKTKARIGSALNALIPTFGR